MPPAEVATVLVGATVLVLVATDRVGSMRGVCVGEVWVGSDCPMGTAAVGS